MISGYGTDLLLVQFLQEGDKTWFSNLETETWFINLVIPLPYFDFTLYVQDGIGKHY